MLYKLDISLFTSLLRYFAFFICLKSARREKNFPHRNPHRATEHFQPVSQRSTLKLIEIKPLYLFHCNFLCALLSLFIPHTRSAISGKFFIHGDFYLDPLFIYLIYHSSLNTSHQSWNGSFGWVGRGLSARIDFCEIFNFVLTGI